MQFDTSNVFGAIKTPREYNCPQVVELLDTVKLCTIEAKSVAFYSLRLNYIMYLTSNLSLS